MTVGTRMWSEQPTPIRYQPAVAVEPEYTPLPQPTYKGTAEPSGIQVNPNGGFYWSGIPSQLRRAGDVAVAWAINPADIALPAGWTSLLHDTANGFSWRIMWTRYTVDQPGGVYDDTGVVPMAAAALFSAHPDIKPVVRHYETFHGTDRGYLPAVPPGAMTKQMVIVADAPARNLWLLPDPENLGSQVVASGATSATWHALYAAPPWGQSINTPFSIVYCDYDLALPEIPDVCFAFVLGFE